MGKEPALPKNIRQIGDIQGAEKICMEDYVMTYIRKKEAQEEQGYLGIFVGEQQASADCIYVFIRGILEIPAAEMEDSELQEYVRSEKEKFFPKCEIQGCCVIGAYPAARMEKLAALIPESCIMLYHLQEQEESLYWMSEGQYKRIRGYFVFYEQNHEMQEYLTEVFREDSVEKESQPDKAIKSFREKVKEKGLQRNSSFLRLASSFLVITVLTIGAIAVNRVEDIRTIRSMSGSTTVENEALEEQISVGNKIPEEQISVSSSPIEYVTDTPFSQNYDHEAENVSAAQTSVYDAEEILAGSDQFWEDRYEDENTEPESEHSTEVQKSADAVSSSGSKITEEGETKMSTSDSETSGTDLKTSGTGFDASGTGSDISGANTEMSDVDLENADTAAADVSAGVQESAVLPEESREASSRQVQAAYVIKSGDTLADICSKYYGSLDRLEEICRVNEITDANLIMPGQKIVLP